MKKKFIFAVSLLCLQGFAYYASAAVPGPQGGQRMG